jgi:uncharacterized protein DUF1064
MKGRFGRLRRTGVRGRKVELDGHKFDSVAEARRYGELKLLQAAHAISGLEIHPNFPLFAPCGAVIGYYEADFRYVLLGEMSREIQSQTGIVTEDVKGERRRAGKVVWSTRTALYRWKRKHFEAQYGERITEVAR